MINLNQSKRNYYIVALKGNKEHISEKFYSKWKITPCERMEKEDFIINKMLLKSRRLYHSKNDLNFPLNKNNKQPYTYEILLIEYIKIDIYILCIPFIKLTKELVSSLVTEFNIIKNSNFIKPNLTRLVQCNEEQTDISLNKNHFIFGGVFLSNKGDSFLSSVRLTGDKPLESNTYKTYFKEMIKEEKFRIEKLIIKCDTEISQNKSSAIIQIDKLGNYKFYIHNKGKNLFCIIALFELLNYMECFIPSPHNPTTLIEDE